MGRSKVILDYRVSLEVAWDTRDPKRVEKEENKKGKKRRELFI